MATERNGHPRAPLAASSDLDWLGLASAEFNLDATIATR